MKKYRFHTGVGGALWEEALWGRVGGRESVIDVDEVS